MAAGGSAGMAIPDAARAARESALLTRISQPFEGLKISPNQCFLLRSAPTLDAPLCFESLPQGRELLGVNEVYWETPGRAAAGPSLVFGDSALKEG